MRKMLVFLLVSCLLMSFVGAAYAAPADAGAAFPTPKVGRFLTNTQIDDWVRSLPPSARGEFGRWIASSRQMYQGKGCEAALFVFASREEFQAFLDTSDPRFAEAAAAAAKQYPCPEAADSTVVAVLAATYIDPTTGEVQAGFMVELIKTIAIDLIYRALVTVWNAFIDAQGQITWVGPSYTTSYSCPYCGTNGRMTILSQSPYSAWLGCYCGEQFQIWP